MKGKFLLYFIFTILFSCKHNDFRFKTNTLESPKMEEIEEIKEKVIGKDGTSRDFVEGLGEPPAPECASLEPEVRPVSIPDTNEQVIPKAIPVLEDENYPYGTPIEGAIKIFASKYQTCDILTNIAGSDNFKGRVPGVLDSWKEKRPQTYPESQPPGMCKDSTELGTRQACRVLRNPCTKVASSPLEYSQGWRQASVVNGEIKVLQAASDCSSFISASMLSVGLKMNKSSSINNYATTTAQIEQDLESGKSCFNRIEVNNLNDLIRPGDVINDSGNGHVVMIDSVGLDPFGVEKIIKKVDSKQISKQQALANCERIDLGDMNLSIIHSTRNAKSGSGIMKEMASVVSSGAAKRTLIGHAREVCERFVSSHPTPVKVKSKNGVCATCSVLRHKGKSDPACMFDKKYKVEGEGCINGCI
jgi:hypothetical protein